MSPTPPNFSEPLRRKPYKPKYKLVQTKTWYGPTRWNVYTLGWLGIYWCTFSSFAFDLADAEYNRRVREYSNPSVKAKTAKNIVLKQTDF